MDTASSAIQSGGKKKRFMLGQKILLVSGRDVLRLSVGLSSAFAGSLPAAEGILNFFEEASIFFWQGCLAQCFRQLFEKLLLIFIKR